MEPEPEPEPARKSQGPRACRTCAKAKSRCIAGPTPEHCERCHRLNKPCSSQTPAPPRKRRSPKPTRVSQLERRLEDLTARLDGVVRVPGSGSGSSVQQPTPPESAESPDSAQASLWEKQFGRKARRDMYQHLFPRESSERSASSTAVPSPLPQPSTQPSSLGSTPASAGSGGGLGRTDGFIVLCPFEACRDAAAAAAKAEASKVTIEDLEEREPMWPRGREADILLDEYRAQMAPLFPFVTLPAQAASGELRVARPLLWKAVMLEACHLDGARQMALGDLLLGDLTAAALTAPKRGLDVLQALELFIAWHNYAINSFQTTNLLYLTRSIAASLKTIESMGTAKERDTSPQALEEMRAFLGAHYITTLVFASSKKADGMMNSAMVELCCEVMEQNKEQPHDELLVHLTRVQLLAQDIASAVACLNRVPISEEMLVARCRAYEEKLDSFAASIPDNLKSHDSLISHIHAAKLILYEPCLQVDQPGLAISDATRLDLLWRCLAANRAFFHVRFRTTVETAPRFICLHSFEYMYCFLLSLKLIILPARGWDAGLARRELRFDECLDRQIGDMALLAERRRKRRGGWGATVGDVMLPGAAGSLARDDPFDKLAKRLGVLKAALAKELGPEELGRSVQVTVDMAPGAVAAAVVAATATPAAAAAAAPLAMSDSAMADAGPAAEPMALDPELVPQFDLFQDINTNGTWDMFNPGGWDSYLNMSFDTSLGGSL